MNEKEHLRQLGFLVSEKQYKKILIILYTTLIITALVGFSGMLIMLLSSSRTLLLVGLAIFASGGILLGFESFFLVIKYAAKIQLYRHYKKHPEDFETDVNLS